MIRKLSLILTLVAVLGLVIALAGGCGKKGPLKIPETAMRSSIII
tara:strand:+ start:176 stop:310 length:135 start_codon:yes stop_codon:yes gene_type:complete